MNKTFFEFFEAFSTARKLPNKAFFIHKRLIFVLIVSKKLNFKNSSFQAIDLKCIFIIVQS